MTEERIDDMGFGGLKLIQNPKEFCYGVDAVLLADFAAELTHGKPQIDLAVDLGAGTGAVSFIFYYKRKPKKVVGIEIQRDCCQRAVRSSALNGLEDRITFVEKDVRAVCSDLSAGESPGMMRETAEVVLCNPPYFKRGGGIVSKTDPKAIARHEITAGLQDFVRCAAGLLRAKGDFFMVHRPDRLADVCCFGREAGLEPKDIRLVCPRRGMAPNIMLLHFVKGGGCQLNFLPEMAVYTRSGEYTEELLKAYAK